MNVELTDDMLTAIQIAFDELDTTNHWMGFQCEEAVDVTERGMKALRDLVPELKEPQFELREDF